MRGAPVVLRRTGHGRRVRDGKPLAGWVSASGFELALVNPTWGGASVRRARGRFERTDGGTRVVVQTGLPVETAVWAAFVLVGFVGFAFFSPLAGALGALILGSGLLGVHWDLFNFDKPFLRGLASRLEATQGAP